MFERIVVQDNATTFQIVNTSAIVAASYNKSTNALTVVATSGTYTVASSDPRWYPLMAFLMPERIPANLVPATQQLGPTVPPVVP